jgi:hypothetical protein
MTRSWDDLTSYEKLEILLRDKAQVQASQNALTSNLDGTWGRFESDKIMVEQDHQDSRDLKSAMAEELFSGRLSIAYP